KFDESHLLALLNGLVLFYIPSDSSGYCTGDLSEQDIRSGCAATYSGGAFVICAGLWMPRHQVQPRMVTEVLDYAGYRIPVDMDIQWGHKDAHLSAWALEIFIFYYLFDYNYFSIARGDHEMTSCGRLSFGYSEKL